MHVAVPLVGKLWIGGDVAVNPGGVGKAVVVVHGVAVDAVVAQPVLPAVSDVIPQLDIFLMEIELQMEKLHALLCEKVKGAGIIDFSTIIKGIARIEAIRTFILLLFLAQDGRVSLWQNEETEEVYIAVGNVKNAGKTKPTI